MGQPAARFGDMHVCPMVTPGTPPIPHVGGPILPTCSINVLTGKIPQARVTDKCLCVGPPDVIVKGSMTVLVNKLPAARMFDSTAHGGVIMKGEPTVLIGDAGAGGGGAFEMMLGPNGAMQMMPVLSWLKASIVMNQTAPGIFEKLTAIQNLLLGEIPKGLASAAMEHLTKMLTKSLGSDAATIGRTAFDAVRPYVTLETANEVSKVAMRGHVIAGKIANAVPVAAQFVDAAIDAYSTHKYAQKGNLGMTAVSAANTTGSVIVATVGVAIGATAMMASAPLWATLAVGAAVALGGTYLWNKFGQAPTEQTALNYINDTSKKPIPVAVPVIATVAALGVATVVVAATAPVWVAGIAAAGVGVGVAVGGAWAWNKLAN